MKQQTKMRTVKVLLCFIASFLLHNFWSILCFLLKGSWLSYKEIIYKFGNVPITSAAVLLIMNVFSVVFIIYGFFEILEILGIPEKIKKIFNNLIDLIDSKLDDTKVSKEEHDEMS